MSELARRTSLQKAGVARVCVKLEDLGAIESVGRGVRNRQYRRAGRFPFSSQLSSLFHEERGRAEQIIADVRQAVSAYTGLRSAWIEGPVATSTDVPGDAIEVVAVADAGYVESVRAPLWARLLELQRSRDVSIALKMRSLADLRTLAPHETAQLASVILLAGPSPVDLLAASDPSASSVSPPLVRLHEFRDRQALAIAGELATRIRHDPSIIEDAARYIARRLAGASAGEQLELREWNALLDSMSSARLIRFLTEDTERATRLRQSLPFLDVLSPEDRTRILAAVAHEQ